MNPRAAPPPADTHWVPIRSAPDAEALAWFARTTEIAYQLGGGYVGIEHAALAFTLPQEVGPLADASEQIRAVLGLRTPAKPPEILAPTPRMLAIFGRLPRSFGADEFWAEVERELELGARYALRDLPVTGARKPLHADTMATHVPASAEAPAELEVLGGPEDGRYLMPSPGHSIGGQGASIVLYDNTPTWDPTLKGEMVTWLGGGSMFADVPITRIRNLGFGPTERVEGTFEVFADDVLVLSAGTRLRAAAPNLDFGLKTGVDGQGPEVAPPRQFAGRYSIVDRIGWGGMATVFAASDDITGQIVALKVSKAWTDQQMTQSRRETAALRYLQLPGCVNLLDDGIYAGWWFAAMERIEGTTLPFAQERRHAWSWFYPKAAGAIEVLTRMHYAGMVHGDLKPQNIMVDSQDRVFLLDFGLSRGAAVMPQRNSEGGTPLYWAPEQAQGKPPTMASDVYSLGVIFFELLTGRPPHVTHDMPSLIEGRASVRVESLGLSRPDIDPHYVSVIDAMLAVRPEDRPADAAELARLMWRGVSPFEFPDVDLPAEPKHKDLERLFHGPEHFHHLPSDGATALWDRTDGRPDVVRAELGAWVRAALTTWDQGRLRIRRTMLNRLAIGDRVPIAADDLERLARMSLPERLDDALATLLGRSEDAWSRGRDQLAAGWAELGLRIAPEWDAATKRRILRQHTEATMDADTSPDLLRAIYELERILDRDSELDALRHLIRALRTIRNGEVDRSEAYHVQIPPLTRPEHEIFERWRREVGSQIALVRGGERWAQVLNDNLAWASQGEGARRSWGHLQRHLDAYYRSDWQAALQAAEAALREPGLRAPDALRASVAIAASRLEQFGLADALEAARSCTNDAFALRHANLEARATLVARCAEYRLSSWSVLGQDAIDGAELIYRSFGGLVALSEAAHAWRIGDLDYAAHASLIASTRMPAARPDLGPMCRALHAMIRGLPPPGEDLAAHPVPRVLYPEIRLQTIALQARALGETPQRLRDEAQDLAPRCAHLPQAQPIDVLSLDEALASFAHAV